MINLKHVALKSKHRTGRPEVRGQGLNRDLGSHTPRVQLKLQISEEACKERRTNNLSYHISCYQLTANETKLYGKHIPTGRTRPQHSLQNTERDFEGSIKCGSMCKERERTRWKRGGEQNEWGERRGRGHGERSVDGLPGLRPKEAVSVSKPPNPWRHHTVNFGKEMGPNWPTLMQAD